MASNEKSGTVRQAPMRNQETIHSIQVLRGLAASMVLVLHCFVYLEARGMIAKVPELANFGKAGVDIFFVISGFIMIRMSEDNFAKPGAPIAFLVKRIIRIAPTYWCYTLLMGLLAYMFPYLVSKGRTVSIEQLAASLFFVPWKNSLGDVFPVIFAGWTLNYEMYFYLIFSFLLVFKKTYFIPLLATILLLGLLFGFVWQPQSAVFHVCTSPLLMEFLMGCTIGVFYGRNISVDYRMWYTLLFIGAVSIFVTGIHDGEDWPRVLNWGVPSALIVASSVWLEKIRSVKFHSVFIKLGDSSYSLYLSHVFSISLVGMVWKGLFGTFNAGFIVVAFLVSIVVGYAAYLIFEKPITYRLNFAYKSLLTQRATKETRRIQ